MVVTCYLTLSGAFELTILLGHDKKMNKKHILFLLADNIIVSYYSHLELWNASAAQFCWAN